MALFLLSYLLHFTFALPQQDILGTQGGEDPFGTNIKSTRSNANAIFSAIHSAGRQWGSSVNHNGVSFFPATVPEGTVLYHGSPYTTRPSSFEWLALEIQHAEMFAIKHYVQQATVTESFRPQILDRRYSLLQENASGATHWEPGYLHIYRAPRPLKLIYVDGMSAAKCPRGSMDSQNVLVNITEGLKYFEEGPRAKGMCAMAAKWGLDGIVRMEIGFEIIMCDFKVLDLVAVNQKPAQADPAVGLGQWSMLEYVREVSQRYMGNQGGRLVLNFSSMVSAFFYPANLTNPTAGPRYPMLSSAGPDQVARIRADLGDIMSGEETYNNINWQATVDLIVARYSDRLQYMATGPPHYKLLGTINNLLNVYIDYNKTTSIEDMIKACTYHYLDPYKPTTASDHLIFTAIETVANCICSTLFVIRAELLAIERALPSLLHHYPNPATDWTTRRPLEMIQHLNEYLDWTVWRMCPTCALDEVCFIAMFPIGRSVDHDSPGCRGLKYIDEADSYSSENYWWSPRWTS